MAEQKRELKTYEVDYVCDECKNGRMRPTGVKHLTHPARYPHVCGNCGHKDSFPVIYPNTVHE